MKELTIKQIVKKLRCIFSRLTKLEQGIFEQGTFEQVNADWNATSGSAEILNKPDLSLKADLVGGTIPASQLPSYVDDILEFADLASLPVTGETGKIYITLDDNKLYRWSGSIYVEVSAGSSSGVPMQIQLIKVTFDSDGNINSVSSMYNNTGLPDVDSVTKMSVGKYLVKYGGPTYWIMDVTINTSINISDADPALIGHISSINAGRGLITIRNPNTGAFADPSASDNNAAFTFVLLKL